MQHLRVAPIVEGDGEVAAVPILIRRICQELIGGCTVDVLRPIRQPRSKLLMNKDDCLANAVEFAARKLRQRATWGSAESGAELVLVLVDADDGCAATLGPETQKLASTQRSDIDIACVLAVVEYETWFVASAASLEKYLQLDDLANLPLTPETDGLKKTWIANRFRGVKYSETVDQPKLTASMNLKLCRDRSPSFDKLCRELEARAGGSDR